MHKNQRCCSAVVALVLASTSFSVRAGAADVVQADTTLAWWRFESAEAWGEGESTRAIEPGMTVVDSGPLDQPLRAFSRGTAPRFSRDVPGLFAGRSRGSLDNTAEPERFPTRDVFAAGDVARWLVEKPLKRWTVEASVKLDPRQFREGRFQTFVGRDGFNVNDGGPLEESPLANFGLKLRGDTMGFSVEAFDQTGRYVVARSIEQAQPGRWYHLAAVSDGQMLRLYVRGDHETEARLHAEVEFDGAMKNGGGSWSVGRGYYTNQVMEQAFAWIDEVRITADALPAERWLMNGRWPAETARASVPVADIVKSHQPRSADQAVSLVEDPQAVIPTHLIHVHDPAVVRVGDRYHLVASHEGYIHYVSNDLLHWTRLEPPMPKPMAWGVEKYGEGVGQWAPDLVSFGGRYWFYYSFSTWGSRRSSIGVMSGATPDPREPGYAWTDHGPVVESEHDSDFNAIDPSVLVDDAGVPWMAYGSYNRGIFLLQLDAATGKPVGERVHLAARPFNGQIEAAHLMSHEGWYYLLVSFDGCCAGKSSTYKLAMGRSRDVRGPYLDRQGRSMADGGGSLVVSTYGSHIGPGQSSMVELAGRQYLAHHYYDGRLDGRPTLAIREVVWEEGWPLVGEPIAEAPSDGFSDVVGEWTVWVERREGEVLRLLEGGEARLETPAGAGGTGQLGSWRLAGDRLEIKVGRIEVWAHVAGGKWWFVGMNGDGRVVRGVRQR